MSNKCSGYKEMKDRCKNDYVSHAPYYCESCYNLSHADLKIKYLKKEIEKLKEINAQGVEEQEYEKIEKKVWLNNNDIDRFDNQTVFSCETDMHKTQATLTYYEEEKKVEITESQFDDVYWRALDINDLKKQLGF